MQSIYEIPHIFLYHYILKVSKSVTQYVVLTVSVHLWSFGDDSCDFISVDIAYICLNIQLFIHKIQEPICFIRTANMYNFWYNLLNPYIGNGILV